MKIGTEKALRRLDGILDAVKEGVEQYEYQKLSIEAIAVRVLQNHIHEVKQ